MLRRDMIKLGLSAPLGGLPAPAKPPPKRPPPITLRSEKGQPLTMTEMDDNMRAVRALIERLDWED